jgi:peptide deformylase
MDSDNDIKLTGVLPLGDPRLRLTAAPVADPANPATRTAGLRLMAALESFRRTHGFGRGIAAPQIGIPFRFIALNLGEGPFILLNPEIAWRSAETYTLWDDCMCFPDLLVRVRRHRAVTVRWTDAAGQPQVWERLEPALSELLQHEIDHLDGILAVDRAEGTNAIVRRAAFDADPDYFRRQVDHS